MACVWARMREWMRVWAYVCVRHIEVIMHKYYKHIVYYMFEQISELSSSEDNICPQTIFDVEPPRSPDFNPVYFYL